ncbi:hypothetical protein Q7P37_008015 [Cladosporium fusiforme]
MSDFCEDLGQLDRYPNGLIGKPRKANESFIQCLQWGEGLAVEDQNRDFSSVSDFTAAMACSKSRLRVVFLPIAPLEKNMSEAEQFRQLFRHYSIPSAVPAERMRNVSHSFGASTALRKDLEFAWFHFLCRNVEFDSDKLEKENKKEIIDLGYLQDDHKAGQWKDDPSRLWMMCDFFLHIKPPSLDNASQKTVTMLCFGAPDSVFDRFKGLLQRESWVDIAQEPYLLFDLLFNDLHEFYDQAVWKLSQAVNPAEKDALQRAGDLGNHGKDFSDFNFRPLHNIQKNCVFMVEAAEASKATLNAIIAKLEQKLKRQQPPSELTVAAIEAIEYRRQNFNSTSLRLRSVDQRLSNVVQLTRTMVNQADSAILKADSRAMKFIAALTLVFLPATGVASVFDTPFFENENPSKMTVANNFWIFWAVVGPLTVIVAGVCLVWYYLPKSQRFANALQSADENMFMPFRKETWRNGKREGPDKRKAKDIEHGNADSGKG